MSDTQSEAISIDEDEFFSTRGSSNELPRNQYVDHSIWEDESTNNDPTYTAFQSLPSGVEHEVWRGEAGDEDAPDLIGVGQEIDPAVARIEALEGLILSTEEGAPTPAYPTVISDEAYILRAEGNPWDAETVIPRVTAKQPLQESINIVVRPSATTNETAQPADGARQPNTTSDATAFNDRSRHHEETQTLANSRAKIHSSRDQKKSKKKRKNGKPSSMQEHREGHQKPQGQPSRAMEALRRHTAGTNGIDGTPSRDGIAPRSATSRPRKRGRDHTASTVRSDGGPLPARLNPTHARSSRRNSDNSSDYKGFCWGWKPSWWSKAWQWPHNAR